MRRFLFDLLVARKLRQRIEQALETDATYRWVFDRVAEQNAAFFLVRDLLDEIEAVRYESPNLIAEKTRSARRIINKQGLDFKAYRTTSQLRS